MRQVASAIAFDALFLYPSADRTIGPCLAGHGEFARAAIDFLRDHLPPDGAMCDAGANIGTVSIPLARMLPGLSAFAFEPQLPIYRLLMKNIALNGLMSVEAFPWALGEADGLIHFPTPSLDASINFGAVGRGSPEGDRTPVIIRKLDSLKLPRLDVIKIDVEGFDLEVVRGAAATIRSCSARLTLLPRPGSSSRSLGNGTTTPIGSSRRSYRPIRRAVTATPARSSATPILRLSPKEGSRDGPCPASGLPKRIGAREPRSSAI